MPDDEDVLPAYFASVAEDYRQSRYIEEPPAAVSRLRVVEKQTPPTLLNIMSSPEFVAGFTPPDYLIDGLCQKRFFYSLTAPTGAGKTAIALVIAASVALGRKITWRQCEPGNVLYLAGENPDDVRMRWIAMAEHLAFDIEEIPVFFRPGVFAIPTLVERIGKWAGDIGGVSLIVVDTSAAYFQGIEENSNVQVGAHARSMRSLCTLPGEPCVIAACHPTKNAAADNMLPRGGGAFIAEVDGNLTCMRDDTVVSLHWQGKFRGPEFDAIPFELQNVERTAGLIDSKGRPIPTVIANAISEQQQEQRASAARSDEDLVLELVAGAGMGSLAETASSLGWTQKSSGGVERPYKMKVKRVLDRLKRDRLVEEKRGKWTITEAGTKTLKALNAED
jgi:hypothetical protein